MLGLNHPHESDSYTWGECADAPIHPDFPNIRQCWNLNEPAGPYCNVQSKVSNNLMDYNASQSALSPCQVGIMQGNLNTCLKNRYVYKCSDCLPPTATCEVAVGGGCMPVPIWLDGRAAVAYHWYKLEIDQLNANGGLIGGTHFETTVYQQLDRIRLDAIYAFAAGSTYQVKLTTSVNCGLSAVRVRTLTTPPCIRIMEQPRNAPPANPTISSTRK